MEKKYTHFSELQTDFFRKKFSINNTNLLKSNQKFKSHKHSWIASAIFLMTFLFSQSSIGQVTLFQFNFENTAIVTTNNVTGLPTFTSNGTGTPAYSTTTPCQGARMLTANNWDTDDYERFTVNTTGFANMSFSFCNRTDAIAIGTFIVRVSADAGANWTTVLMTYTPTTNNNTLITSTFPAVANNETIVWIEIYKTGLTNPNNARTLFIDAATLTGYRIPTLTSFTPTTACAGQSIVITGTNFTGATAVNFNGVAATSYVVNSATQITAVVPSGITAGKITVTTPGGTATSTGNFTPVATNTSGTASSTPELCVNTALSAAITHTTTGATGIGSPTNLPSGVTASWSSNTIIINGTPTVAGIFNYSIPLTGGCRSVNAIGTITVNGTVGIPTVITIASGTEPSCQLTNGTTTTSYTTTATNNSGFNWSLSNSTAGTINATTGVMTWANGFSGTVDIQVTANGCNGPTAQVIRTVTVAPTVGMPTVITFLAGTEPTCQLTNATTTTSYATTAANNTGFNWSLSNGSAGSIGATTGVINWANGFSGIVDIQVTANGCNGPSLQVIRTVLITANNSVGVASSTPNVCINTALINITHTTSNTTGIDTPINLPTGVIATWASGSITISGTPSVSGTFNYTIPLVDGCGNAAATGTITVENPVGAAGAISGTTTVCQGQNGIGYSVAAIANATSYTWTLPSGATLFTGANTNSITVNYSASAISGNITVYGTNQCGNGIVSNFPIIVNPLPDAAGNISGATTVCQGQSNVVYSVATIANATNYNWILPLGASITSGAGTNTIYVSYDMTAVSGNITVTGTNSCGNGIISETYPITVSITPSIITNYATTICSDGIATVVPAVGGGNIIPIGTTYSWGLPSVTGGVTGAIALSNQTTFAQVLSNPTNVQQTASYNVTASTNGCSASTFSVLVYINPKPTIALLSGTSNQSFCSGDTMIPIIFYNPNAVAGTIDYNWTRNSIAGVTGMSTSGTGATISGSLSNTTSTPQTIIFTVTATSEDNCISNPFTVSVVVNPTPTVTVTNNIQNICSESGITPISINPLNAVSGTIYSWTSNNPNVTGILNGSGTAISGSLTNATNSDQSTIFTISATANGCTINTVGTATITVKPKPIITVVNPAAQILCGGIAINPILYSSNVTGTTFGWTRDTALTGMPTTGSGSNISGTLNNFTNANLTVTFTITANVNGCNAITTVQIIVKPTPQVVATPSTQSKCNALAMTAINLTNPNNVTGTTYGWTRDNTTALTGIANSGSGNSITGTLTNTTASTQTTTFTITATAANGCSSTTTASATIYAPLSAPIIGSSQTSCLFSTPSQLFSITPVNGGSGVYTYQWQRSDDNVTYTNIPGATTSNYQPGLLGFGADNTFYRLVVTNICGSVTSNIVVVEVVSNVGFSFGVDDDLNGAICPGSTFSPSLNSFHFRTSAVRFRWSADSAYITPGSGGPVGTTGGAVFLIRTSSATIGPLTVQNNTNATVTTQLSITPDVYNYPGPPSGAFICSTSPQIINVTIFPKPVATATIPATTICNGTPSNINIQGNITDATMSFAWSRNNTTNVTGATSGNSGNIAAGGSFTITTNLTNTTAVTQIVKYTITPSSNGCTGAAITIDVIVAPNSTPGVVATSQTICYGGDPAAFTVTTAATGLNLTYQWQKSTDSVNYIDISGATNATYNEPGPVNQTTWYRRVVFSTVNGTVCSSFNTTPIVVTVNTINPGTIGTNQTICSGGNPAPFTSVPATGSGVITYQWQSNTIGCLSTWNIISGATFESYDVPAGLLLTTYYQRIAYTTLNSTTCSDVSNCVVVYVNNVTGGTVGSDQTLCGNNPAAFTEITPSTGSGMLTYQWQSSTTGCFNWSPLSGATASTYDVPAGLAVTTSYQRITYSTLNFIACSAVSNCITVTVNTVTAGAISGNKTICNGGDPSAFTETIAATGMNLTYQWQVNTTGGAGPWNDISGATNATYDAPGPINRDSYFRRVVTTVVNGVSCSADSNFLTVFVNNVTASVISGNQNVCGGTDNPNAFTLTTPASGKSTLTYQWQSSTTGCSGPWTDIPSANAATYDSPSVTQTTYFHVRVTSTLNGEACSDFSNCVEITSFGKVWTGAAISANTDWNNGLNWNPNGVPNNTHCVIIPNVTNKPIISGTNYEAEVHSLTILANSSLQVTSTNNITVTDFVNVNPTANFVIQNNASLIQVNDSAINNGHISYTRTSRPMTRWGYVYWGSPVVENIFAQIPSQFDLKYRWQAGTLNGAWLPLASTTQGEGFITRVKNIAPFSSGLGTINFTFNGTPGNGLINVNVDSYDATTLTSAGNTMLLANPYPSALDATKFLTHSNNTELGGTLFFWTSVTLYSGTGPYAYVDYASWNLSGGVGTSPASAPSTLSLKPSGKIAAGQGFFAQVFADGTISFNNQMRGPNFNNQFFRTTNSTTSSDSENNRIWLNLYSDTTFRQMMVNYKEEATNGIDRLYDGNSLTSNEINIYSIAEDRNLVIQGRALPFDQNDIVPLGYRITNAGQYSIAIDELDGLFTENQNIYLRDKLLNIDHDLKTSAYSFNASAGTVDTRFELVYVTNTLGTNGPSADASTFASITDNIIKITSSELIKGISIYDISGKLINKYDLKEFKNQFTDVFNYPNGVYIAKITLDTDLVVTKKLLQ